jgi:hypothetical protein
MRKIEIAVNSRPENTEISALKRQISRLLLRRKNIIIL